MRQVITLILILFVMLGCEQEKKEQALNVLLICVDDLRPELRSFGANYIHSPHIDKLAANGVAFNKHFVNAPSCGPSRYTLLTGQYGPRANNALFVRAERMANGEVVNPSMPEWFKSHGYTTVSIGKVSHHPGGLGGADWNDSTKVEMPNAWDKHLMPASSWEHPRGAMHGLAKGEVRIKSGDMDVFQAVEGNDKIYPDGTITEAAISQLKQLGDQNDKPFFLAVGIIRPHLPFGAPKSYLDNYEGVDFPKIRHPEKPKGKTTWHGSGEFNQYNRWGKNPNDDPGFAQEVRRHYAACVSYADAQVGKILTELKTTGADKNTVVILWGDHGWHLGEHAIWGKHSLFEESLHSPMIIQYPDMENKGSATDAIAETVDIYPTLCDLVGLTKPNFLDGVSLTEFLDNPDKTGHSALAYTRRASTIRTKTHRLTLHDDGFVELYDHTSMEKETNNVADENPELVDTLLDELKAKLP